MLRHAGFDVSEQAAGGAFLSSASVTRSHCRQPAEQCGWMASCIVSGSHWAGVPDITWQAAWQSRSVKIRCLERFAGARPALANPCARSALTTGPGARDASTAPSSVISSAAASLHCCRIARVALVPPGCAITPASSSLPGIVARATATPHPRVRPRPYKSPIVGTSSKRQRELS